MNAMGSIDNNINNNANNTSSGSCGFKQYRLEPFWRNEAKYWYHPYHNQGLLPMCLILTFVCFLLNGGVIGLFMVWGFYFATTDANQKELDNNPRFQKKREWYEDYVWKTYGEKVEE